MSHKEDNIEHKITEDLLLREIEIFHNHTTLEIAIAAEAFKFIGSTPVQDLLTDIWYDRMEPDVSNWKVRTT